MFPPTPTPLQIFLFSNSQPNIRPPTHAKMPPSNWSISFYPFFSSFFLFISVAVFFAFAASVLCFILLLFPAQAVMIQLNAAEEKIASLLEQLRLTDRCFFFFVALLYL
jgi:hypothetical protein